MLRTISQGVGRNTENRILRLESTGPEYGWKRESPGFFAILFTTRVSTRTELTPVCFTCQVVGFASRRRMPPWMVWIPRSSWRHCCYRFRYPKRQAVGADRALAPPWPTPRHTSKAERTRVHHNERPRGACGFGLRFKYRHNNNTQLRPVVGLPCCTRSGLTPGLSSGTATRSSSESLTLKEAARGDARL